MGRWCGYLSGARCRLFAYGPADATSCIPKPDHLLPHLNPDWFYLFGTSLPRLFWKEDVKRVVILNAEISRRQRRFRAVPVIGAACQWLRMTGKI